MKSSRGCNLNYWTINLIALIAAIQGTAWSQASWSNNTYSIYTNFGTKVGIGRTPASNEPFNLDVRGTTRILGDATTQFTALSLRASDQANSTIGIKFTGDNNVEYAQVYGRLIAPANGVPTDGSLVFQTKGGGTMRDRMTITESGNVIINQATLPTALLHVEADGISTAPGNFPTQGIAHFTSWAGSGPSTDNDLALYRFIAGRISTNSPNSGNATIFEVANDDRRILNIRGNGRIGIGTKTPQHMLHMVTDGTSEIPGSFPAVDAVQFTSWADDGPSTDNGNTLFRVAAGRIRSIDANAAKARIFEVSNDDTRILTVKGNGRVGVKQTNPEADLHVGGTLKVDGAINVGSVVTSTWTVAPDYVFEKDYKLRSLDEVDSFVKKNKHLPEVPSAKEFKEKGMDLAEMNFVLLKKVEELTLHAIRHEKEMGRKTAQLDRLSEQMDMQAEEIRKLKANH